VSPFATHVAVAVLAVATWVLVIVPLWRVGRSFQPRKLLRKQLTYAVIVLLVFALRLWAGRHKEAPQIAVKPAEKFDATYVPAMAHRDNSLVANPANAQDETAPTPGKAKQNTGSGDLSPEEQALLNKGAIMEIYKPDEHSRRFITHVDAVADSKTGRPRKIENPQPILCFVFGLEDAQPARKEGRSMAEVHYSRSQAEQFLFAQGWDEYHDRFFTRAYVQEGLQAYDNETSARQKERPKRDSNL
jgi:hypothetical protein